MKKLSKRNTQIMVVFATTLGSIYIIIGAAEFIAGVSELFWPNAAKGLLGLPADLFGGFSAVVIGVTYIGSILLWKGRWEFLGFLLVATLLSIVFGALYLFIVCADGFGVLLGIWEGEEWTWEWLTAGTVGLGILRPEIWLGLLSLPLAYFADKTARKRSVYENSNS